MPSIVVCVVCLINFCLLFIGASLVVDLDEDDILDMTFPFDNRTVYYPAMEQLRYTFTLGSVLGPDKKTGQYQSAYWFQAAEHGGTHIDAPSHLSRNGVSVEHIPISQLIGSAVVIDVSAKVLRNPDYQVTPDDIESWEEQYGKIPDRSILFLFTGWAHRKWPHRNMLFGTQNFPDDTDYHFPGLQPAAAEWLVHHRELKAIGIDGPSLDSGENQRLMPSQRIMSKSGIVVIEFVANLEMMPATGAVVIGLPMKIAGGTGAPIRLVAFGWRNGQSSGQAMTPTVRPSTRPSTMSESIFRSDTDRPTRRRNGGKSTTSTPMTTSMTRATAAAVVNNLDGSGMLASSTKRPKDQTRKPKAKNSGIRVDVACVNLIVFGHVFVFRLLNTLV